MVSEDLLEILRCPMDHQSRLALKDDHLACTRCHIVFRIKNGLPNLVVEEAKLPTGCESLSQLPCQQVVKSS